MNSRRRLRAVWPEAVVHSERLWLKPQFTPMRIVVDRRRGRPRKPISLYLAQLGGAPLRQQSHGRPAQEN